MTLSFTGIQDADLFDINNTLEMSISGITNSGDVSTSGDIRVALWAVDGTEAFDNYFVRYYELASFDVPAADMLNPGETESALTFSGTYLDPIFGGRYNLAIVLLDDDGTGDPVILDYQFDDDILQIGPPPPASGVQRGTGDDDELTGMGTRDSLFGRGGDDSLYGAGNADLLKGGAGEDRLFGGGGTDLLYGNNRADLLYGGGQTDTLYGGAGNDILNGGGGADQLFGGGGNDTMTGAAGADAFDGGKGSDTVSYVSAGKDLVVSLANPTLNTGAAAGDTFARVENLIGSSRGDLLIGNGQGNDMIGDFGQDELRGLGGHDRLEGGHGNDTLMGQAGRDTLEGGFGNDILQGGRGADTLSGSVGRDTFLFTQGDLDGTADRIIDFERGDKIDLSDLGLTWIGQDGFSGQAGELRYAGTGNGRALADLDGDGAADLTIWVEGFVTEITRSDFVL